MNLTGKTFRAVENSKNGSLNTETEMHFTSDNELIVGDYSGGTIAVGHVLGKRISESEAEMLYHAANEDGQVQAGRASAIFSTNEQCETIMNLEWQWLTGDRSRGCSKWMLQR